MDRFQVTLKSLSGLLQNRMSDDALLDLRDKTKKKSKTAAKPTLEQEAESKIHFNADGHACIPREMLMACLINTGVFIRLDAKRQLTNAKSSVLPGLLVLEAESFPLLMPGSGEEASWGYAPWRYEIRKGKNPNGGEAVCIVRPLFEIWAITFTVLIDTDELPEDTYLRLFNLAGKRIGLGDYRPQCKGTCGQFVVTRWKNVTGEEEKLAA
jgi:hypothetical protein